MTQRAIRRVKVVLRLIEKAHHIASNHVFAKIAKRPGMKHIAQDVLSTKGRDQCRIIGLENSPCLLDTGA